MKRFLVCFFLVLFSLTSVYAAGTVINTSFQSQSPLIGYRDIQIYLPEGYTDDGDYPVVYYLHGANCHPFDSYPDLPGILNSMIGGGFIDPIILVRPHGGAGSFGGSDWVNSALYGPFEDYIVQEVPNYIETNYPGAATVPYKRAIIGHSMGGGGAMHTALKHHDFYAAVASHSGALDYDHFADWVSTVNGENGGSPPYSYSPSAGTFTRFFFLVSGAHSWNLSNPPYKVDFLLDPATGNIIPSVYDRWYAFDPATLAASVPLDTDLKIYFDCGTADEFQLYPFSQGFDAELTALGLEHTFYSYSGGHGDKLENRLRIAIRFIDDAFRDALVGIDDTPSISPRVRLLQNVPNPFNPATTISFQLYGDDHVSLEILDAQGRRVETLFANRPFDEGRHEVLWQADGSPSGVYFYRLRTASGYTETRKATLLK